nr:MAG TPA: hypothetical protein [Caudoviricetes sp.]DAX16524.1 MAG TPA: hypothetical protein [Caudoviricetes sp.]DAX36025.1 MAG TPA: hypothetical protein [Caudoviricetes sp.]
MIRRGESPSITKYIVLLNTRLSKRKLMNYEES